MWPLIRRGRPVNSENVCLLGGVTLTETTNSLLGTWRRRRRTGGGGGGLKRGGGGAWEGVG